MSICGNCGCEIGSEVHGRSDRPSKRYCSQACRDGTSQLDRIKEEVNAIGESMRELAVVMIEAKKSRRRIEAKLDKLLSGLSAAWEADIGLPGDDATSLTPQDIKDLSGITDIQRGTPR